MAKLTQKTLTLILAILLILALAYIIVEKYLYYQDEKQLEAYRAGYELAVTQLMQQLSTCQPVPIQLGNQTLSAIAVECLQTAQNS